MMSKSQNNKNQVIIIMNKMENIVLLKKYNLLTIAITILLTATMLLAQSQTQTQSVDKHNEQVTIVSYFDPSINQAYKVNTSPEEMQFSMEKPEFTFESLNIELPTNITLNPIKPVVINADKRTQITNNSLKLGVGSLISPYLDFFHSSGQKNNYRFDAHLYHLSTFKNIKDYSPSPQTNTYLDLNFRSFIGYHILDAGIDYSLKTNQYYGFKPNDYTILPKDDDLKQMFNLAKVNIGLASNYKNKNKLSHNIMLDAYYYFDKYSTSETNANLNYDIHKNFEVSSFLNYQELGVSGKVSYFQNADSIVSTNEILVSATPYFNANYGIFNFHIGLNFNLLNTTVSNFYFYPIIDVNINLVPDVFTIFAGLDGDVEKQSFLMLSSLNPWISSDIATNWDNTFKAYGGIRGNIANKVNYSVQASWHKFNNMFFFVNIPGDGSIVVSPNIPYNKFTALYDGGSKFTVSGEITYAASSKMNVNFGAKYNSYSLNTLDSPYHKPISEINLGISFLATEKIRIWTDVYYYGTRTALDSSVLPAVQIDLDGFVDLNIGVDYKLTNQLSAFLSLTNLLNKQYQRYYHYPVNGIQIMGGIMYKF